jgi:structure-specific recognition protein 1
MRLYIPNKISDENQENGEDKSVSSSNEKEHSAAMLKEHIMKYANVGTYGDAIVHLPEMPMITPRGKFDLYFLKNMMKIHGPSHDYKLSYKNIFKALLLPKPDGVHFAFVLGLTNPLRQGNTSYPFLVFQLKTPNEKTVSVNLPEDEEERKLILKSEIDSEVKGELIDIVAKLFKSIVGVSVIIPGHFRSFKGASCLKCSLKASEGYIYLLERGIIFIHKPVVYIGFEEIRQVEFSRISDSSMQQRTFDITIRRRNEDIQFMGIEKNELEPLSNYLIGKKVVIKSNDGGNIQEIKPSVSFSNSRLFPRHLEELAQPLKKCPWIYLRRMK